MSSINSIGANDPIQRLTTNPIQKSIPTDTTQSTSSNSTDKVELSGFNELFQALKQNDIRTDKVAQVRSQIEAGTYETDDKINAALDKLLDDITK
jgi:anti-sigma28 factor (negative regulator of flagellin synthesis)